MSYITDTWKRKPISKKFFWIFLWKINYFSNEIFDFLSSPFFNQHEPLQWRISWLVRINKNDNGNFPHNIFSSMTSVTSESVWSSMIAARQLSTTYYTLSTCLTDYLHRYFSQTTPSTIDVTSSLFHNLDEMLHSPQEQSKLLDEYSNIIQNILKWVQNTLRLKIRHLTYASQIHCFSKG